jgi:uncharacterized protein
MTSASSSPNCRRTSPVRRRRAHYAERLPLGAFASLAALLALLSVRVNAAAEPSFDCARASAAAEKLVCGNKDLADLDRRVAVYYAGARRHFSDSGACLQHNQREWLSEVRNKCGDAGCLRKAYLERLATLDAAQPGAAASEDLELPRTRVLAAIIPPNGDADSIPQQPAKPVEIQGRYALSDDYGLTLTDEASRLYVLASLLNQSVPIELAALERENALIIVRGRLLEQQPAAEDDSELAAPAGAFDPHACIFVYRLPAP